MRVWQAHQGRVAAMAFSPDGRALVTAAWGQMNLAVWDGVGAGPARRVGAPPLGLRDDDPFATPRGLAFSACGRYLAAVYGRAVAVAPWRGRGPWANTESLPGVAAAFAPASAPPGAAPDLWAAVGDRLRRYGGWGEELVGYFDAACGPAGLPVLRAAASPCGLWVASNGKFGAVVWDAAGHVKCWRKHPARSHDDPLAFGPGSATLALAHNNNKVTLWDFAAGAAVELVGHKSAVWGVGYSPGGEQVHTVSSDGTARSFDAGSGRQLRALDLGLGALYAAAFSPDGLTGAAGSADGRAAVFDLGE